MKNKTLNEISRDKFFRTDKGEFTQGNKSRPGHNYWQVYEDYFAKFKEKNISLLEVGFGAAGDCLRTFAEYFENAEKIVGIDWNMEFVKGLEFKDSRIIRHHVNQNSVESLNSIVDLYAESGPAFDIIIDDGSHQVPHIRNTLDVFFSKLLKPGGVYVIEDTYQLIDSFVYNASIQNPMSTLILDVNEGDCSWTQKNAEIQSVHFYRGIIFIKKGPHITRGQLQ